MGFSVSGAAAVIFASLFVAFGMWFSAAGGSVDQVSEAQQVETDRVLEVKNAGIDIWSATYDNDSDTLSVSVNNTGATQIYLGDVSVLIDGNFTTGWKSTATVDARENTSYWFGGETLQFNQTGLTVSPDRVKIVGTQGIADTDGVDES